MSKLLHLVKVAVHLVFLSEEYCIKMNYLLTLLCFILTISLIDLTPLPNDHLYRRHHRHDHDSHRHSTYIQRPTTENRTNNINAIRSQFEPTNIFLVKSNCPGNYVADMNGICREIE